MLAAKIAASAFFVLGGTAAAEWLGPRLGSILGSAPQLAVLSLIFFSIEQGPAFAAESAFWTIPGMGAAVPVYLGYLMATRLVPAPRAWSVAAGVSLGTATLVVATLVLSAIPLGPLAAMPFAGETVTFGGETYTLPTERQLNAYAGLGSLPDLCLAAQKLPELEKNG